MADFDTEMHSAVTAARDQLIDQVNGLIGIMESHAVAPALRSRIILSAIGSVQLAALRALVDAGDRQRVASEIGRRVHVALMTEGATVPAPETLKTAKG